MWRFVKLPVAVLVVLASATVLEAMWLSNPTVAVAPGRVFLACKLQLDPVAGVVDRCVRVPSAAAARKLMREREALRRLEEMPVMPAQPDST